jgi:hypothetical protein
MAWGLIRDSFSFYLTVKISTERSVCRVCRNDKLTWQVRQRCSGMLSTGAPTVRGDNHVPLSRVLITERKGLPDNQTGANNAPLRYPFSVE